MSELKTYLIEVPSSTAEGGALARAREFNEVLTQLHETCQWSSFSLEILANGQSLAMCFTADPSTAQVVAGQIYSAAPKANIVEIADFTSAISEENPAAVLELGLKHTDLFPLMNFSDFEKDSLSGVLSVLAEASPGEINCIQIVLKSKSDSWFHHFILNFRKFFELSFRIFRVKYWFKKGISSTFKQKISEKVSGRLYRASVRICTISPSLEATPEERLGAIFGSLTNLNTLDFNQFTPCGLTKDTRQSALRNRELGKPFLLSTQEVAAIFHLPSPKDVPNLTQVFSVKEAPPPELPVDIKNSEISFFGFTNFRDRRTRFGIKSSDRRRHSYVVGKSGSGKSKLLELLINNDIASGRGVGVLDPHGDLIDNILRAIPKERVEDVVIFDPTDLRFPASFNPLEQVSEELKMRVTIGFIEIFKKLFGANWTPRLEHVLRYTTLALMDTKGTTILSIQRMLTDKNYRQQIVRNIQDSVVKNFWVNEFASWSERFDNEAITPLLNKVGQFIATNMVRNIVGQPENRFDFRKFMDERKIVLMKVPKGVLGQENASLLGAMAVTKIYQAAMSRADIYEEQRVDFYFYVDEFHNFATDTFDEILSEARKYRLNLTLANQFLGQLDEKMRRTVFGNVGTLISFCLGSEDAGIMAREFAPRFSERDLINLGVREFCIKMLIDGQVKEAFSGKTAEMGYPKDNHTKSCIEISRARYARPLQEVQEQLSTWEQIGLKSSMSNTTQSSQVIAHNIANDQTESFEEDDENKFEEPLI